MIGGTTRNTREPTPKTIEPFGGFGIYLNLMNNKNYPNSYISVQDQLEHPSEALRNFSLM